MAKEIIAKRSRRSPLGVSKLRRCSVSTSGCIRVRAAPDMHTATSDLTLLDRRAGRRCLSTCTSVPSGLCIVADIIRGRTGHCLLLPLFETGSTIFEKW